MDRDKVVARANELLDSNPKPYMYRNEVVPGFLAADLIIHYHGKSALDNPDIQIKYRKLVLEVLQNYEEKRFKII